jgi:prephenate dehydrogenase
MNVFIIGIGLIGGSMARDIRRIYPGARICGIDINTAHLEEAMKLGLIDEISEYADLPLADIVVVGVPVDIMVAEIPKILDNISDDTVVIDAGSTKALICQTLSDHPRRRNFLACHPIAGTEFSGPSAAMEGLLFAK